MIRGRRGKHRVSFETGNHPGKRGKVSNQEKLRGHKIRKDPIRNGMNRQTASSINKPTDKETYWDRFSYFGKESRFFFPHFGDLSSEVPHLGTPTRGEVCICLQLTSSLWLKVFQSTKFILQTSQNKNLQLEFQLAIWGINIMCFSQNLLCSY